VVLFSATLNLLFLAPSLYMLQVYDRVLTSGGLLTLVYLSAVLLASLASLAFLDGVRMRLLTTMAKRFDRLLAPHVLMAALQREGRQAAGQAHVLREFDTLRGAVSGQPAIAAVDAPWTPLYIAVCYLIHPWIGMLALGGGVALVIIAFVNQQSIRRAMRANDQATGAMYSMQLADSAQGETARALGMQGALVHRQLEARETLSEAMSKAGGANALYSATTRFTRLALQSASLGLGAYLALQQEISAGGIIAASILTARAYAPIELIVGAWRQFEQGSQAYRVLKEVLKTQNAPREFTTLPEPSGALSVEGVSMRSPAGDRLLLSGASFRVDAGEIVGVVGPSGAGKTTLMRVIAGAVTPDQGAVRLDGAKLTDWAPDSLGPCIGYLPQDVGLFAGTVSENISRFDGRLGYDPADVDRAVIDAAKAAGVHEMILSMPRGYDTEIAAGGRGVSAGQAQRVALARALYGDPILIVLDEPNAHLDADGEIALINALKAARERGATCIVVAHRAGFMNIADKLMVVQDGRIEAFGPRDQIAAKLAPAGRPVMVTSAGEPTGRRP
jgi:ATP-binding cassette subfamily C protein